MQSQRVGVEVEATHESYERLVTPILEEAGLAGPRDASPYVAHIVLDYPLTWALARLEACDSLLRARTLVMTPSSHPAYHDCLASFHVAAVVTSTDQPAILSGVYAAATAQRTYQWKSGLTYMELRVARLILQGNSTREAAVRLSIAGKTVNAHVSNILTKLGFETRAQLIAALLGSQRVPSTGSDAERER